MSSTPANIAADEVKDPLPSVVDDDMGRRVCNDEQNKDTNNTISTNMNDYTRDNMASMAKNMASLMDMMKSMQGEISRLSKKCDTMEKALRKTSAQTLPKKQNANIISRLDSMEKSMQKTHTKYTQMEKSIQTMEKSIQSVNKKQISMHTFTKTRFYDMDDAFDSVDEKLKYHGVLLKNQKWKYSAKRPSYEYWEDELHEDEAESFLWKIEDATNQMRNGTNSDGYISIGANLPYHNELRPHWIEFANSLKQYQYHPFPEGDNETTLRLWGVELPVTVINLLSESLKSTQFHKFELERNNFGQEGINFALDYLENNYILKQFKLYDNPINNKQDIKRLCQIIKKHPSIEELSITGYRWHEGLNTYQMLKSIMNAGKTKLTSLGLSSNRIRTGGGTFISNFLAKNRILENLHIDDNHLIDNDAIAIASALKSNTKLLCLNIGGNDFTDVGWEALEKAVFNKTSLNSAADSNHSCTIDFPNTGLYQEIISMNGSDSESDYTFVDDYVRQKKIYNILSTRNRSRSNVEYFEDLPFELFPDMVVSIEEYSDYHTEDDTPTQDDNDVNPLSIVYEICRNWEECLAVFESLSS